MTSQTSPFPAELCGRIFTYACTDGGRTGCAIGLVSKYIRATSERQRHRSVSLFAVDRILMFAKFLAGRQLNVHVEHLFISTKYYSETDESSLSEDELSTAQAAIRRIVTTVAHSLRHLSLNFDGEMVAPYVLFQRRMQVLSELELDGVHQYALPEDIDEPLPALRRLHVVVDHDGQLVMRLVQLSTNLTHFRASGLYWDLPEALSDALAALGTVLGNTHSPQSSVHFPPHIEAILLQPLMEVFDDVEDTTGNAAHADMISELECYASNDSRIYFLNPPSEDWSQAQRLQDWLDRVEGGPGCWDVRAALVREVQPGLVMSSDS